MQFFFADDSSQQCTRKGMGRLLAFGGILMDGSRLRSLSAAVDAIASNYGLPKGEEIKWSPRKGSWIYEHLKDEKRLGCYSEVLGAAAGHGCQVIIAACDYELRHLKPEWGFERCVQYALERVSTHLTKLQQEAVIISDRPSGGHREADEFLKKFVDHLESGHNHMLENTFALNMLTAQSHMIRALQVADLVVSITAAMLAGQTKWAGQYFEIIKPMFLRNALGYIGGTGVKVYPDLLINLYHWVLGEQEFSKAGMGAALPLPFKQYLFSNDDGTT
jgi:hypothetical protein